MSVAEPIAAVPDFSKLSDEGYAFYVGSLQSSLEPHHNGKWIAIHLDTGDYALGDSSPDARRALRKTQPTGMVMTMVIGPDPGEPALERAFARTSPSHNLDA